MALAIPGNYINLEGAIQKWIDKNMMDLKQEDYMTPLANPSDGVVGTLPEHSGQSIEFRYFDHFTVTPESATDDSPKQWTPSEEPTTGQSLTATSKILPIAELVDSIGLQKFLLKTDPIDILNKTKIQLRTLIRRMVHQHTNSALVQGQVAVTSAVTDGHTDLNTSVGANLPGGFNAIYAGGVDNFSDLTETSYYTMEFLSQGRTRLENSGIQTFPDGTYHCVLEHSVKEQLAQDDAGFRDIVKRHESTAKDVFHMAKLPAFNGITFILQHDGYRCNTPASGGTLAARQNGGRVQVSHLYGPQSYGYIALGGKNPTKPTFRVTDFTLTGIKMDIAFRIPVRSTVFNANRGLNLAGTTNYYKTVADAA